MNSNASSTDSDLQAPLPRILFPGPGSLRLRVDAAGDAAVLVIDCPVPGHGEVFRTAEGSDGCEWRDAAGAVRSHFARAHNPPQLTGGGA